MAHRSRQLSLDLRNQPRWGGKRAGAGRKPGAVRRDAHRRRPAVDTRRHAAKLGRPVDPMGTIDPASSGRWFSGWRSRIAPPRDAPAVAPPRTWILAVGWKRARAIDPAEVPGAR